MSQASTTMVACLEYLGIYTWGVNVAFIVCESSEDNSEYFIGRVFMGVNVAPTMPADEQPCQIV